MIKTVSLQPFSRPHMFALIDFLESFLPQFEGEVDVMFGWAWAMEFYNWEERTMPMAMVRGEVQSAESQDFGSLGETTIYMYELSLTT